MHLHRGGIGHERCGTTQRRSGTGLRFAARSGFWRSGDRCQRCGDSVSADAIGRMRGTARLSGERSRPEPAAMRASAGYATPTHGPARLPGERSRPEPAPMRASAGHPSPTHSPARLPGERSRPEPAPMRSSAGHPSPTHGPARPDASYTPQTQPQRAPHDSVCIGTISSGCRARLSPIGGSSAAQSGDVRCRNGVRCC